jgi:DNA-binding transcriptional MerR regulator
MSRDGDPHYGIRDLVQLTGIPRRTIRYYVQRGLLDPPLGAGRGHYYTPAHLRRLQRVREFQGRGLSLDEIRTRLEHGGTARREAPLPEVEVTTRIHVAPGVEVLVAHGARPPSPTQVRALAAAAREILQPAEGEK